MTGYPDGMELDLAQFDECARATIANLPTAFQNAALKVALRVAEWPSHSMLDAVGLTDPFELTGLYEGIPMTERSTFDQPHAPDVVWLFRGPILAEWRARGDVALDTLIAHVTIHEFAHHFGWTDADIASVDRWWE